MKLLRPLQLIALSILVCGTLTTGGCRKKKDTVAKIYVRDSTNMPVSDVSVHLFIKNPENDEGRLVTFDMRETTNASGEAIFMLNDIYQLGQAGVVVADIEATKGSAPAAKGIIKIDQEVTSEETVFF